MTLVFRFLYAKNKKQYHKNNRLYIMLLFIPLLKKNKCHTRKSLHWLCIYIFIITALCLGNKSFSTETAYTKIKNLPVETLEKFWTTFFEKEISILAEHETTVIDKKEQTKVYISLRAPDVSTLPIANVSLLAEQGSAILELAWLKISPAYRNKRIESRLMQGIIECAKTCNFNYLEFLAACIDHSISNPDNAELEFAERYTAALHFYAKYKPLPNPFLENPCFNPNASVADFYIPLIIPFNEKSQNTLLAYIAREKIKKPKKSTIKHTCELHQKNNLIIIPTVFFFFIPIKNFLKKIYINQIF